MLVVSVLPARVDWLEALVEGDDVFTERFGIPAVADWVGFPDALPATLEAVRTSPGSPWGTQLFFDDDGALVGFGGFYGEPVAGEAELGYAVAPERQGRGIATAVVGELLERAWSAAVDVVLAHTMPEEGPSTAVLRKCGFTCTGAHQSPEGEVWRWERRP